MPDNNDIYYEDFKAMDGKNIGFLIGSYQVDTFKGYAEENDFNYNPSYYATDREMLEALDNGEIDILATGSLSKHDELKTVGRFGYDPFYFMVKEGNNEVLNPLNEALGEIHATNPFFSAEFYGSKCCIR